MNWSTLKLLYIHEMRMLLRSRRTVVTAIVIPAIMMPLMIIGTQYAQRQGQDRMRETTFRYAITGPWAERVRILIENSRNSDEFKAFRIEEVETPDPAIELAAGTLHFYLETKSTEEADKADSEAAAASSPIVAESERIAGIPAVQIVYRGSQDIPRRGARRMIELMRSAQRNETYSRLLEGGFPSHPAG